MLSALFALSDSFSITSDRFLHAILVGYEITIRLAAAIQPGHKKKGFHATGTCGCIGAAAAIATALDYDERSLENTIAAAAASASGLLEMIEDVSQLKPFNAGKAAQNALTAAMIGKSGFSGPLDPIGGKRGFIQDLAESFSEVWFDRKNSVKYAILGIYRKPYASCRHCHSAVEAALFLRNEIKPEEIESIQVYTYGLAVFGHDHTDIPSIGAAKMSIPFSVAAAIILNTGGMDSMKPQTVKDERILQLAKKVHVTEKEEYSLQVPKKRIADVHIFLTSGGTVSKRVDYPKGEPENPMSNEEIELKFRQMAIHAGRDEIYCSKVIEYSQSPDISLKELVTIII